MHHGMRGMLPGIKVDTGAKPLAKAPGETVTEGLDGLRDRLIEYRELGAKFTKWRGVIDTKDVIFFLSIILGCLFISTQVITARRWR